MRKVTDTILCITGYGGILLILVSYLVNMFHQLSINGSCHLLNICNHWSAYTLIIGIISFIITKIILFIFD